MLRRFRWANSGNTYSPNRSITAALTELTPPYLRHISQWLFTMSAPSLTRSQYRARDNSGQENKTRDDRTEAPILAGASVFPAAKDSALVIARCFPESTTRCCYRLTRLNAGCSPARSGDHCHGYEYTAHHHRRDIFVRRVWILWARSLVLRSTSRLARVPRPLIRNEVLKAQRPCQSQGRRGAAPLSICRKSLTLGRALV